MEASQAGKTEAALAAARRDGLQVVEVVARPATGLGLSGIPVMSEDDDEPTVHDIACVPEARGSAPVSVRGRVALAREMMHRAMMELDMAIAEGEVAKHVMVAREHAYVGFVELDNG